MRTPPVRRVRGLLAGTASVAAAVLAILSLLLAAEAVTPRQAEQQARVAAACMRGPIQLACQLRGPGLSADATQLRRECSRMRAAALAGDGGPPRHN